MPDPPFHPGNQLPPNMNAADKASGLDYFAKKERSKLFGYNMDPDAGYEFKAIWDNNSQGKQTALSWYDGLAIENNNIHDVSDAELPHNTSLNRYVPEEGFQNTVINTEALSDPTDTTQQKPYLDSNFKLNMGNSAAKSAADIFGSVLQGQNIGLGDDPVRGLTPVSSYDLRSSLVGRILGGTGAMEDTKLGLIGAQQLGRALQNNVLFNLQDETVGRLNLNAFNLLKGGDIFTPNYEITVPKGGLGKILDFASRVTGFEVPISIIGAGASIFQSEAIGLDGRSRNEELVKFTSAGQNAVRTENLDQNKYQPYHFAASDTSGYDQLEDTLQAKAFESGTTIADESVIDDNGLVKVSPLRRGGAIDDDPKKYMLSLENLAWADKTALLPEYEVGNGDLLSGHKGRIMWFPPYDISISEQVSVRWNEEEFIGRGEPLYTYNNTTRTVQLGFKIVVDHSSVMNGATPDKEALLKLLSPAEETKLKVEGTKEKQETKKDTPTTVVPNNLDFYFANASSSILTNYEDGSDTSNPSGSAGGVGNIVIDDNLKDVNQSNYEDTTDYGLNKDFNDRFTQLCEDLKDENKSLYTKITIEGYASSVGTNADNKSLSNSRANNMKEHIIKNCKIEESRFASIKEITLSTKYKPNEDHNSETQKKDRKVIIRFEEDPQKKPDNIPDEDKNEVVETDEEKITAKKAKEEENNDIAKEVIADVISDRFIDETKYFEYMETNVPFFEKMKSKLRFFHPAFHSTTPEGLNNRLTFLHQCTRQGNSIGDADDPKNLVFGRPPVCILRLGDFFYTKCIINSLNITYEPLQWDMNKDGIGLQPMLAKVDLNLALIGGSSLKGPLNRLQNALSFNYYANTEVYDNRSDTIMKKDAKYVIINGVLSQYDSEEEIREKIQTMSDALKEKVKAATNGANIDSEDEDVVTHYDNGTNDYNNIKYEITIKEDKVRKKVKWDLKVDSTITSKSDSSSSRWRKYTVAKANEEALFKFENRLSKGKYDKLAIE